jgi:2-polyprenyl-3-methyl-5-hydroxy-6-metoxy-1,4-benzoquinol methylase
VDLLETVTSAAPRHPWELRRSSLFNEILRAALAGKKHVDVLDCGAGDGCFSSRLRAEMRNCARSRAGT